MSSELTKNDIDALRKVLSGVGNALDELGKKIENFSAGKSGGKGFSSRGFSSFDDDKKSLEDRLKAQKEYYDKNREWAEATDRQKRKMLEEEAERLRKQFEEEKKQYDERQKKIDELNAKTNKTADEQEKLNELVDEQNDSEKEILKTQDKQLANAEKQHEYRFKLQDSLKKIKAGVEGIVKTFQNFNDAWAKADHAASQFTKTLGGTQAAYEKLRKSTINTAFNAKIGINYNMSIDELLKAQESYSKAVGRNIRLGESQQENLAAMSAIMGPEGATQLAAAFENFGVGMESTAKHAGKMFAEASEAGISFEKYSSNVRENISIAQNYTFQNGLKGLESMARKATAIKMDMRQIESMANKVNTIEGSMETAAKLQVLGGPFAGMADPMGMLREGLTDMEGLMDRFINMTGGLGSFNRNTGEVEVTAFNKARIRQAAEAMGMDYNSVMTSVNAQAKRREIERQLVSSGQAGKFDDKMTELLKNSATFENGKAGISINGQFKELKDVTQSDYSDLVLETQDQAADVKDIAKNLRSLVDMREGAKKQLDITKAKASEWSGLGQFEKNVTSLIGKTNFFLEIIAGGQVLNSLGSALGNFGKIGKLGRLGKGTRLGRGLRNLKASRLKAARAARGIKGAGNATKVASNGSKVASTASKVGKFGKVARFAKGAGVLAGVTEGVLTGIDEFGGDKNYGATKKVGRTAGSAVGGGLGAWGGAAAGAAIGSVVPVVGTLIGGLVGGAIGAIGGSSIGKWIGGGFASQERRDRWKTKLGLQDVKGDYSVKKLKKIEKAVETGEIDDKLRRELKEKGDTAILEKIRAAKKENKENIEKNLEEAYFNVENAHFGGRAFGGRASTRGKISEAREDITDSLSFGPIGGFVMGFKALRSGISKIRGKSESGSNVFNSLSTNGGGATDTNGSTTTTATQIPSSISLNVNGTIKLTDAQGRSLNIAGLLLKDSVFIRELTQLINKQMTIDEKATNVVKKPGQ